MDAAGRVLVPPLLREFAGLVKDVVMAGQGAKFELWNEKDWSNTMDSVESPKDEATIAYLADTSI